MTHAIFSLLPVRSGSTVASVRIGRWLSDLLGIPLFDDARIAEQPLDTLFIINGSTLYCKYLPEIAQAVTKARSVIWVQNDYTLPPPKAVSDAESPFRRAFADRGLVPDFWTTCGENAQRTPGSRRVNWNALGAFSTGQVARLACTHWLYYGAWRQNRERNFRRMAEEVAGGSFTLVISSTSNKFGDLPGKPELVSPFRIHTDEHIASYGMGIYAQDDKSAAADHCPATRFYEMLSVGLPMAFTPDCVPTLRKYGYNVSPYALAHGAGDSMMKCRKEIAAAQTGAWMRDFQGELAAQVLELWKERA